MFNKNSGYGLLEAIRANLALPVLGKVFICANSTDPVYDKLAQIFDTDPSGDVRLFSSLSGAEGACVSDRNDVVVIDAKTSLKVTAMLTLSKNRVHYVGFDGGGRLADQRTLISNTGAGAATDVAMVRVTGTGRSFRNIKFANNWTVAQNLYCLDDQSSQTYFENCTIQNLGSAHLTNASAASLRLSGDTCLYKHCTIGQDTLKITSTAGQQMLILAGADGGATAAHRVVFENCQFESYTSDTTHAFIRVTANGAIDRYVRLENPRFMNFNFDASNGGAQLAVAIASTNSLISGGIIVVNPTLLFATKLATNAVGNGGVYVHNNTAATAASADAVKATA